MEHAHVVLGHETPLLWIFNLSIPKDTNCFFFVIFIMTRLLFFFFSFGLALLDKK